MKKFFVQDYTGHKAAIELVRIRPYKGAKKQDSYRLMVIDPNDDNFLFHVSVYETFGEAKNELDTGFGPAWKEIA